MATTTATVTIAEGVRLDLGHTDLVGSLVYEEDGLVLVTPNGTKRPLGHREYTGLPGSTMQAPEGHILIEEMGLTEALPAALVGLGHFQETDRHAGRSFWGADVVELRVLGL